MQKAKTYLKQIPTDEIFVYDAEVWYSVEQVDKAINIAHKEGINNHRIHVTTPYQIQEGFWNYDYGLAHSTEEEKRQRAIIANQLYPKTAFWQNGDTLELSTILRKYHEGNYYFVKFYSTYKTTQIDADFISEIKIQMLQKLTKEVYYFQHIGKIDPTLKINNDPRNRFVYPVDKSFKQESDRILELQNR